MKEVYLETSVIIAWLLGEPSSEKIVSIIDKSEAVTTSILALIEAERSLIRAENQRLIRPADRQRLKGLLQKVSKQWNVMEITEGVQARAVEPFPVEPVRSLDAIHLATALEFVKVFPDLRIASLDRRVLANLEPLGLGLEGV